MSKQNYQVVRYKYEKIVFEALFKPGCALKVREGKLGISNATFADEVFIAPHNKGNIAKPAELSKAFPGKSGDEILKTIAEKGEIQFSSDERKQQVEDKKKRIVEYIHNYYVDPATNKPHPIVRINNALDAMKLVIDPEAPMEKEIKEVEKKLNDILPSKRLEVEAIVTVPNDFCKLADGAMKKYGRITSSSANGNSKVYKVSIIPGDFDSLNKDLAKATRGNYQIDLPNGQTVQKDASKKKGKKGK
ncbi:rRNA metabolism protein, SBDS family protein [Entamoeba nuttalli P19]|uniref:rRNA metabolism protein, SBDS family protein n=1 Tax=Entamoeba nuttalli (strain P19) TaxID=1076696 RepID=K2GVQ3_ENTNP|nr:rRNA metabolism protein, SBDS family protein [Entamoeba nuttalli P19]EKE39163.1 rRNA metabolism protein, SBDS family protein [Entamoeba nuttalli P19]|eukprot:XP_008858503.1 rRNA metabolism protein, SBDS family protein [Entamoeba nuttalli P19]